MRGFSLQITIMFATVQLCGQSGSGTSSWQALTPMQALVEQ
jgi:hypothetical protein